MKPEKKCEEERDAEHENVCEEERASMKRDKEDGDGRDEEGMGGGEKDE